MASLTSILSITLIVMIITFVITVVLGRFGVSAFVDTKKCAAYAMAVLFAFTAVTHFVSPVKDDLIKMVPDFVPLPAQVVFITGILELLGAIGLLIPRTRRIAGICLILLLIAMFPANVYAALKDIPFLGDPATPLWFRIPEQIVYIGMIVWAILPTAPAKSRV